LLKKLGRETIEEIDFSMSSRLCYYKPPAKICNLASENSYLSQL
jgi:hypothetical protein